MVNWIETDYNSSQSPLSLTYIKILRLNLQILGCWPGDQFGKKLTLITVVQKRLLPVQIMLVFAASIYFLLEYHATVNFFIFGHILIICCLCLAITSRAIIANLKDYGSIMKEFIHFHLINHIHKGGHYKKICNLTEKVSYYFTLYQLTMMVLGVLLFSLTPIYNNYIMGVFTYSRPRNLTLDHAVYTSLPGYIQDNHLYISTLVDLYSSLVCGLLVCMFDLLICLISFQIMGHIKTLMLDFETMKLPNVRDSNQITETDFVGTELLLFDEEENYDVHVQLIEMVKHHKQIVSFVNRISNFFGPIVAISYMSHLVSLCILLVECSSKNTKELARFGPLTFNIFGQLIQLSVVFEVISYMSEKLIDSVYYAPWECMDVRNRRSMLILLNRVQHKIEMTAFGCVPVGVKTMLAIIKTTLSYFAMLQTLSQNN